MEKIVTSIMTLELLESHELDYIHFWCIYRGGGGFWISGKGVYMYKGTGFAFLIYLIFLKIPMKMK